MTTPLMLTEALAFLIEFVDLKEATGDPEAMWETHQIHFFNNTNTLTADVKSRQIGWSFNAAAEAVAFAHLHPKQTNLFLSMTQTEANEKIRYATYILEGMDPSVRLKKIVDNKTEIEFSNGSRIISHPCRPPRGKAQARVYVDEFAHYPQDDIIYTALVPIISRGGVIRTGSSPLGATGKFWEICQRAGGKFKDYKRRYIPWWLTENLCTDIHTAGAEAPFLRTYERVEQFGTDRLRLIFGNMVLQDFQQEYECSFIDDSVSWITWTEIKRNQEKAALEVLMFDQVGLSNIDSPDKVEPYIREIHEFIRHKQITPILYGGMDVGRDRNLSEIILISKEDNGKDFPYRLGISFDRCKFEIQQEVVRKLMQSLPIKKFHIDNNGLGKQLAENMATEFPGKCLAVDFTHQSKADMAVTLKVRFQNQQASIPIDRNLAMQLHSVKRLVTPSKNIVFDVESTNKHHADLFWSLALAHSASATKVSYQYGYNRLSNYRG